ncbi:MAG TPA: hypothetical protein PKL77_06135 [Candidatus Omnitrophota bacterium]|nr:hypothetical protein [Candidatus Omnitrophota bacterium]
MNKQECEAIILETLREIRAAVNEYSGKKDTNLNLFVSVSNTGDKALNYYHAFNQHWDGGEDEESPINISVFEKEKI